MTTRHTFAAALVVLAIAVTLWPVAIAQERKPDVSAADASYNRIPADADERERKIYEALSKPTDIDFEEKPLKDVIEKIAQTSGIQIQFDEKALNEAAIDTNTPVTKHLRGISLRSVLRLILRPLQLTYDIRNGVLLITSQSEAENHLVVRIYPVRDLVSPPDEPNAPFDHLDFDPLIDLINAVVAPPSWDTVGGPASGNVLPPGLLAFSQTIEVHDEIAALLDGLRKARDAQNKAAGGPPILLCDGTPTRAIRRALDKTLPVDVEEQPLAKVVNELARNANVQIVFDEKALTEAGIVTDTPVTKRTKDLPLRDSLDLILRPVQLTHTVRDEVLVITSQTEADNLLSIRLYPVQDLVRLVPAEQARYGEREYDFDYLIDAITASISAQSWDTVGGPGSIQPFENSMALVISQTDDVHGRVENLLEQIRRASKEASETRAQDINTEPVLRVYTLNERIIVPKTEKSAQPGPSKESDKQSSNTQRDEQLKQTTLAGFGSWVPNASHQLAGDHWAIVPPQGVPPEEAAQLIRNLVQPETWNEAGLFIQPATNRLLVKHKLSAHLEIAKLLQRLGPWQEEDDGHMFMRPKVGGFLGGGLGGGQNMSRTGMGF